MRTHAREAVLKLLYSELFEIKADEQFKDKIFKEFSLNEKDTEFAKELYKAASENFEVFSGEISALSKSFALDRIFKIDKCAIIIAMTEIKYFESVPAVVAIDEAVKLVKRYSQEESANFVNGILAAYKLKHEGAANE